MEFVLSEKNEGSRVDTFSPGTKEKEWVWNGVHSASWVQLRSYLIEK
jgi:hypothetical protein